MNAKKMKVIFLLISILLVIILIISFTFSTNNNDKDVVNQDIINSEEYVYDFGNMLDLEKEKGDSEQAVVGTDYPSFGVVSDYYDGVDITYYDDKAVMETFEGNVTISLSWMDEGFAKYIKEPDFGNLKKFMLKKSGITASYTDVKFKDASNYIKDLSDMGFSDVVTEEKNRGDDIYKFCAKKENITATVNYENGSLFITVY